MAKIMLDLCSKVLLLCRTPKKATHGSVYKSTLTTTKNDAVLNKAPGIVDARLKIHNIKWYVPQLTPSIPEQSVLSKKI